MEEGEGRLDQEAEEEPFEEKKRKRLFRFGGRWRGDEGWGGGAVPLREAKSGRVDDLTKKNLSIAFKTKVKPKKVFKRLLFGD